MPTKTKKTDNGKPVFNQAAFEELAYNALLSRSQLVKSLIDPRRDIDDECGYPSTEKLTIDNYKDLYDREAIAARVVEVLPDESWMTQPSVFETEDADEETAFELAWTTLDKNLRGKSWYQDDEGSPIWEVLHRADVLSGIGAFGVLLIGIDDGAELDKPLKLGEGGGELRNLLYLRAFDESLVSVETYETDIHNPRYSQPETYNVSFGDPNNPIGADTSTGSTTRKVHWTRLIHLADNLGSSEVFGIPRMRPVFNRVFDLRKIYAGSAEMYWRGAFPGLALETDPKLGGDVEIDVTALRDTMEKYMTGLQRYLAVTGMTVKSLAPQVVDPTPQIDAYLKAIAIRLSIPVRIFVGSERGELASSQDAKAWNKRVAKRQNGYVTPRIIVPFVDRLISVGVLPTPAEGYSVVWPDLDSLTEDEQATIAVKRTEALAKYVAGDVQVLVPPMDFLTRVLSYTQEEATAILEAANEDNKERDAEEEEERLLLRDEGKEDRGEEMDFERSMSSE